MSGDDEAQNEPVDHARRCRWRYSRASVGHWTFCSTRLASRKFRILAVNDDCCRENLCLMADTSISGARVARELDALVRIYSKPACIVSGNGTEFTSRAILKWANENDVEWHYIDPGKPQQNAITEAFNVGPPSAKTRRTLEQFEGSAPDALAQTTDDEYENQTRRLSL